MARPEIFPGDRIRVVNHGRMSDDPDAHEFTVASIEMEHDGRGFTLESVNGNEYDYGEMSEISPEITVVYRPPVPWMDGIVICAQPSQQKYPEYWRPDQWLNNYAKQFGVPDLASYVPTADPALFTPLSEGANIWGHEEERNLPDEMQGDGIFSVPIADFEWGIVVDMPLEYSQYLTRKLVSDAEGEGVSLTPDEMGYRFKRLQTFGEMPDVLPEAVFATTLMSRAQLLSRRLRD